MNRVSESIWFSQYIINAFWIYNTGTKKRAFRSFIVGREGFCVENGTHFNKRFISSQRNRLTYLFLQWVFTAKRYRTSYSYLVPSQVYTIFFYICAELPILLIFIAPPYELLTMAFRDNRRATCYTCVSFFFTKGPFAVQSLFPWINYVPTLYFLL